MRIAAGVAVVGALAVAAPAATAAKYPPPGKPGKVQGKPKGPHQTLSVCHQRKKCDFRTIQAAVDAAKAGDKIRVRNGTYREGVQVSGEDKRWLRIIGNPRHPDKVVLEGKHLKGSAKQNAIIVNGADNVTINGFTAQHYGGNGFFVVNVDGYDLNHLRAMQTGVYGIYAFNSTGGVMRNSEAAWNNDGGFYIGQTPPQKKPKRSLVTHVKSHANVIGFSGTNMRYVTITKSQFFNNGTGIVPNALTSELYAPPEDNVIADNDIFWNNFDYYAGAPFKLRAAAGESTPYPVGVGVLLFGGRGITVENNRIYGNYLVGAGMLQQFLLNSSAKENRRQKTVGANPGELAGNAIRNNAFGLDGTDLNGRDLFYDGNGRDNCVGPNAGVQATEPADGSTFAPCPFTGANAFDAAAQKAAIAWALDPTHEAGWIKHPHAAKAGYTPLEHYADYTGPKPPR
jgi:hypothetical protein